MNYIQDLQKPVTDRVARHAETHNPLHDSQTYRILETVERGLKSGQLVPGQRDSKERKTWPYSLALFVLGAVGMETIKYFRSNEVPEQNHQKSIDSKVDNR